MSLEHPSNSFTLKKSQDLNFDDIFIETKKRQKQIQNIREMEVISSYEEKKYLLFLENILNDKFATQKIQNEDYKQKNTNFNNPEKQKLYDYGNLADLSYIDLKTIKINGDEKISFNGVKLDPLAFMNIDKLFDENLNLVNLSDEEKFLHNYIVANRSKPLNYRIVLDESAKEIMQMSGLSEQNLADNEEKYQTVLSDVKYDIYDQNIAYKRALLKNGLNQLIISKKEKAKQNLENLKQNYKILDYFPNETLGEKSNSGFGATLLERDGIKYIVIRGTELSDWGDLKADAKMLFGKLPSNQVKEMIAFIDRVIKPDEKFIVIGHSLGGALSQIATVMYKDQIIETYTFNSPGAKKLHVSKKDQAKFAKIDNFRHNRNNKEVADLITNVVGTKGLSPISNLGEDIGSYTIELKGFSSHSITKMVKYIENLPNDSEELKKIKIEYDKKNIKRRNKYRK